MRPVVGILLALALVAGVAGIATYSYNAGVAQGLAQGGNVPSPGPGVGPYPMYPYWGYPYAFPFHGPFGFGFGFFGLLWTFLLVFLLFGLVKGLLWRGYGWGGHGGRWRRGAPPWFEEWHRQAHEPKGTAGTA